MWVFTTIGFFSIVAHRDRRGFVLVRARDKADLSALVQRLPLPRPTVQRTPNADYLFRVVVEKQAMARVLESLAESIDYDNFKDAVAKTQGIPRAKIYHDVWAALLPLQQPKLAIVKSKPKPKRKYGPKGGIIFGEISAAEMEAIDRARAAHVAQEKRDAEQRIAAMPATGDQSSETDAGMMPDTSAEGHYAALKKTMNPLAFARMVDQAKGEGIATGNLSDPPGETFAERCDREIAALKSPTDPDPHEITNDAQLKTPPAMLGDVFDHDGSDITTLRARMGDAQFERFSCSGGVRVPSGEAIKTDAGATPTSVRPEYDPADYATEAEATAALRARLGGAYDRMSGRGDNPFVFPSDAERLAELKATMNPLLFARMVDQAKGEDIVTGSITGKFETFDEWHARETAALSGASEDPPLKPVQERDPALGKKI